MVDIFPKISSQFIPGSPGLCSHVSFPNTLMRSPAHPWHALASLLTAFFFIPIAT